MTFRLSHKQNSQVFLDNNNLNKDFPECGLNDDKVVNKYLNIISNCFLKNDNCIISNYFNKNVYNFSLNYNSNLTSLLNLSPLFGKMKANIDSFNLQIKNDLKSINNNQEIELDSFNLNYLESTDDNTKPVNETPKERIWWKHLISGATAGVFSRTCTAPIDRVKVMLQVKGNEFDSIIGCLRVMVKEGGKLSLWRGNGINSLKVAPELALRFMFYEQIKRYLKTDNKRQLAVYERFTAGSLAGALSQTIIYPLEVLKTRLCIRSTGQYRGIHDAILKIYRQEGIRSFYRGFMPNLLGIIPYAGIDLATYETLKNMYLINYQYEDPSFVILLMCGIISSTTGQIFSYPFALIRTRLQATPHLTIGMREMFVRVYTKDGFKGLYKGFLPNFLKVAPAMSLTYVVYENIRNFLNAEMS